MDRDRRARVHIVENDIYRFAHSMFRFSPSLLAKIERNAGYHRSVRFFQKVVAPFSMVNINRVVNIPSKLRYDIEEFNKPENRTLHTVDFDSEVTKYTGVFPANVWFRPAAHYPRRVDVHLDVNIDFAEREKLNNASVVGGSWPTSNHHATRYLTKGKGKPIVFSDYLPAIEAALEVMPEFMCHLPHRSDMLFNNIKEQAHPGPVAALFSSTKGSCIRWSYPVAKWLWDKLNVLPAGSFIDVAPYYPGGRARKHWLKFTGVVKDEDVINSYDAEKAVDSRLVQMPELPSQLVQVAWQASFASYFHNTGINKGTWVYLGQSMVHNGWKRLYEFCDRFCLEGDWEDFDVRVTREDILMAFAIIYSYFPNCEKSWRFLHFSCTTFLNRLFVIPGGEMYYTSKGVPSGSVWTSDVDTIVNIVKWCKLILDDPFCKALNLRPRDFVGAFGGDDFVLGYPMGIDSAPSQPFYMTAIEEFGWRIKGLKVGPFIDPSDDDNCLTFYKTGLNWMLLPIIRVAEMVKRVNTPEKKPRRTWEKWYAQSVTIPCQGKARDAFLLMVQECAKHETFNTSRFLSEAIFATEVDCLDLAELPFMCEQHFRDIVCSPSTFSVCVDPHAGGGKTMVLESLNKMQTWERVASAQEVADAYINLLYSKLNQPDKLFTPRQELYSLAAIAKKYAKRGKRSESKILDVAYGVFDGLKETKAVGQFYNALELVTTNFTPGKLMSRVMALDKRDRL